MENDVPEAAMRSAEADIALRDDVDGSKADLIDGSIGEASLFQETFGGLQHFVWARPGEDATVVGSG